MSELTLEERNEINKGASLIMANDPTISEETAILSLVDSVLRSRAVNAHEELIEALENLDREITALEMFGETGNTAGRANVESAQIAARIAIFKAKGGATP